MQDQYLKSKFSFLIIIYRYSKQFEEDEENPDETPTPLGILQEDADNALEFDIIKEEEIKEALGSPDNKAVNYETPESTPTKEPKIDESKFNELMEENKELLQKMQDLEMDLTKYEGKFNFIIQKYQFI